MVIFNIDMSISGFKSKVNDEKAVDMYLDKNSTAFNTIYFKWPNGILK